MSALRKRGVGVTTVCGMRTWGLSDLTFVAGLDVLLDVVGDGRPHESVEEGEGSRVESFVTESVVCVA
jgi:hypothetical protein